MKKALLSLLAAALLSGCATCVVTREGGRVTADIQNTSWYLLCLLPLASGDPEVPNEYLCAWFKDRANAAGNLQTLRNLCEREHARAVNVETKYRDERLCFFLLKRIACNTSAELIKE